MQIVRNEEPWLPHVYTNTHSISLSWFIVKGDMRCTHEDQSFLYRYMLQQVADTSHWEAWNKYRRDNIQTWDNIPPLFFDSMKYLPIHLLYEKNVGGPIKYK